MANAWLHSHLMCATNSILLPTHLSITCPLWRPHAPAGQGGRERPVGGDVQRAHEPAGAGGAGSLSSSSSRRGCSGLAMLGRWAGLRGLLWATGQPRAGGRVAAAAVDEPPAQLLLHLSVVISALVRVCRQVLSSFCKILQVHFTLPGMLCPGQQGSAQQTQALPGLCHALQLGDPSVRNSQRWTRMERAWSAGQAPPPPRASSPLRVAPHPWVTVLVIRAQLCRS